MTNNARSESVATKPTFRGPWARNQRCLAGLWNAWTDPASGEIVQSYTMILGAPTITQ